MARGASLSSVCLLDLCLSPVMTYCYLLGKVFLHSKIQEVRIDKMETQFKCKAFSQDQVLQIKSFKSFKENQWVQISRYVVTLCQHSKFPFYTNGAWSCSTKGQGHVLLKGKVSVWYIKETGHININQIYECFDKPNTNIWYCGTTMMQTLIIPTLCGVAQWVARLIRNVEVMGLSRIKGPRCFLEQETLPLLLSTGWFQERIQAWFHNQTKIIEGLMEDWLKCQISSLVKYRQKPKPNYDNIWTASFEQSGQ